MIYSSSNQPNPVMIISVCVLNIVLSLISLMFDKYIAKSFLGFQDTITLCTHYYIASICLVIMAYSKIFQVKRLPFMSMLKISLALGGFIFVKNLSIKYTSIDYMHQITRLFTIPVIMIIIYRFYDKLYDIKVILSIVSE